MRNKGVRFNRFPFFSRGLVSSLPLRCPVFDGPSSTSSRFKFQCSSFRPAQARGFTLIELLVVLSIILVVAGIAVTSVSGIGSPKQQLRREARSLLVLLSDARRTAMIRKIKVDVYVDESSRTVCALESGDARRLLSTAGVSDRLASLADAGISSNHFFRTVSYPEEVAIEAFDASELTQERSAVFQPVAGISEKPAGDVLAFSFTHFGGATGGGISLSRGGVRLDLACDILSGRAAPVKRVGVIE